MKKCQYPYKFIIHDASKSHELSICPLEIFGSKDKIPHATQIYDKQRFGEGIYILEDVTG